MLGRDKNLGMVQYPNQKEDMLHINLCYRKLVKCGPNFQ